MEEVYAALAARALSGAAAQCSAPPGGARFMVGIAGAPGSGKSTLASEVTSRINAAAGRAVAVRVPMDGFHLFRRELDQMPDPAAAHARRGAPWTFDAAAYVACLRRLKLGAAEAVPSFDHGVGDPVAGDIAVLPKHRIIISEGNYLLLGVQPPCVRRRSLVQSPQQALLARRGTFLTLQSPLQHAFSCARPR
jgi:pantothenate kinase